MKLSKEQKKEIKLSQKEVVEGNYFEDENLDKEVRQWLEENPNNPLALKK